MNLTELKMQILSQFNLSSERFTKPTQDDFKAHAARRVFASEAPRYTRNRYEIAAQLQCHETYICKLQRKYKPKDKNIAATPELDHLFIMILTENKLKFSDLPALMKKKTPQFRDALYQFITEAIYYGYSWRQIGKLIGRSHYATMSLYDRMARKREYERQLYDGAA